MTVQPLKVPPDLVTGRAILITGGTGSLGSALLERLLSGRHGVAERVVVFSRDEAKQHELRQRLLRHGAVTDDAIWKESTRRMQFRVGDVRDVESLAAAAEGIDTLVHAAALKQVPTCEYFPEEAVRTNVLGAENVVRAARRVSSLTTVVGISTDKAVKPVNVMGMTKSLQERILARANIDLPRCRFSLVRYGNVVASRGSVLPLFLDQAAKGGPLTITDPNMTRFLLTLSDAVDVVIRALAGAGAGETLIPRLPSARVVDMAEAVVAGRKIDIRVTGIRPGEKIHEILISEEERPRTRTRGEDYVIASMLPEISGEKELVGDKVSFSAEYSSADETVDAASTRRILEASGILGSVSAAA